MNAIELFTLFCKYVDSHIFAKENVGTTIAFVVDQSFINEFCNYASVSERTLMSAVRSRLYTINSRNIQHIKGILAIQMYAASKRVKDQSITEKNYRDRLSQVLDWDMTELQRWMEEYQEDYWSDLYRWCDRNFFGIDKCQRRTGTGRYVQFPVQQALRVFTEEDLKYIAACFVDKKLQPGEDILENEFWSIIGRMNIVSYFKTNHSYDVIQNSPTPSEYLKQIFNYYLRWDGTYKVYNKVLRSKEAIEDNYLYLPGDFVSLEYRNANLRLVKRYSLSDIANSSFVHDYHFKRENIILFKKDDIYDNYWQETRFLEPEEKGIAIVFGMSCRHSITRYGTALKRYRNVTIYEVTPRSVLSDFYTQKRFYTLEGGLKVGRSIYLEGAAPILKLTQNVNFWVDGDPAPSLHKGVLNLNYLGVGLHSIKFANYKRLEFEIVQAKVSPPDWIVSYNSWHVSKTDKLWDSTRDQGGIIGLDYSEIPQMTTIENEKPLLRRWAELQSGIRKYHKDTNPLILLLNNIND